MNDVKSQTFSSAVNNKLIVIQRPAHHAKFISGFKSNTSSTRVFFQIVTMTLPQMTTQIKESVLRLGS